MSELDTARTARRLGLTDPVLCWLQAHGSLERLAVAPGELDARLYRAHLASLARTTRPPRSGRRRA